MKYLITGVAGLLGSRLADWIVENTDNEVIGIDDLSSGYIENVNSKISPDDIIEESNMPSGSGTCPDVTVCTVLSMLSHTIVVPDVTSTTSGL